MFVVTAHIRDVRSQSGSLPSGKAVTTWLSDTARQTETTWRSMDGMFEGMFFDSDGSECGSWSLLTLPPSPSSVPV